MQTEHFDALVALHAQVLAFHGSYLHAAERKTIDVVYPRSQGHAFMEIQRLDGPGDEIPICEFTVDGECFVVGDGEGHVLHEIGCLKLTADRDQMMQFAGKAIRHLQAQTTYSIRKRRFQSKSE